MALVTATNSRRLGRRGKAGRLLPALLFALLVHALPVGAQAPLTPAFELAPPVRIREPASAFMEMSLDRAIEMTERRYRARVVKADVEESNGRRVYILRLLSEEGRVWTVRVDASGDKAQ
jgi:hypothetical protein